MRQFTTLSRAVQPEICKQIRVALMTLAICFFLCYHFYIAEALYSQIED